MKSALSGSTIRKSVMALAIEWKLAVSFLMAMAITGAVIAVYLSNVRQLEATNRLVARSFDAGSQIDAIATGMADLETGMHGYLLTGEESFLQPFQNARSRVGARLARLRALYHDRPLGLARLDELATLVSAQLDHRAAEMDIIRRKGPGAARAEIGIHGGKAGMDAIRVSITNLRSQEQALSLDLVAASEQGVRRANSTLLLLGALLLLVALGTLVLTVRHVAMRRSAEAEVRKLNRSLAGASQQVQSFAFVVSNQLAAPLRAITGFADALEESQRETLDDEARRLLSRVQANARHMQALMHDLQRFLRMSQEELFSSRVDMGALVKHVTGEMLAAYPGAKVELEDLPPVMGDRRLLRQVWLNLVENALKYSSRVSAPQIQIGARLANDAVEYWVRDNGAGFDLRYSDQLFRIFNRLHRDDEFEGTGVGLALVHSIVLRHGGTVRAEGKIGKGATFSFTLPANARQAALRWRSTEPARPEATAVAAR